MVYGLWLRGTDIINYELGVMRKAQAKWLNDNE